MRLQESCSGKDCGAKAELTGNSSGSMGDRQSTRWQNVNPCRRTRPHLPPFPSPFPVCPENSPGPHGSF